MKSEDTLLIASAVGAVVLLILLIARWKLNAFVALIVASLTAGLCSGMDITLIAKSFGEGVGAVLSSVAMVVGLGAILGKMLGESGGAEVIANRISGAFKIGGLPWAIVFIALIVGLPVFFTVGVVLLTPIVAAIAHRSGVPFLKLGLPMVAGLSVAHGLVPPHPGPMVAIQTLHADPGRTIIYSLIIGIPAAIIAGPIFSNWITRHVASSELSVTQPKFASQPSFAVALLTVSLPVLLIILSSGAELIFEKQHPAYRIARFIGDPLWALAFSVLISFYTFGAARGFDRKQILKFTEDCVGPTANILFVVGAGGGFNKVLVASGVADVLSRTAAGTQLSPLLLGWLVAALVRVATGSATVGISTAAGILAPIILNQPVNLELLVVAMGAGSLICSHVNDGGFWFVKEYLKLSVPETLRTWTVIETIIAFVGLAGVLLLNQILKP